MPIPTALVPSADVDLPAGDAIARVIPLDFAARYRLVVHNTGDEPITVLRVRYYATDDEDSCGPWENISTDLPIAPDARWTMLEDGQCAYALDVELTSTGGTTVALYLGGV